MYQVGEQMSMSIPPIPKRPERPWNRRLFLILLSIGVLIPTTFIIWRLSISIRVNSDLAALRKAGYPTSMQELERMYYPKLKPEENAASFFTDAFQHLDLTNSAKEVLTITFLSNQTLPKGSVHFSSENKEKILKALGENQEALETLRKTPPTGACHYSVDFNKGLAMLVPHWSSIRASARLFVLEAILNAEEGEPAAAIENLQAALRLSHSMAEEPLPISQLCRISCRATLFFGLEHILNSQQLTDVQLLQIARAFRGDETPLAMEHAMAGELCMGIHLFQMSGKELSSVISSLNLDDPDASSEPSDMSLGIKLMKLSGMTGRDFDYFIRTMSRRLEESKLPFPAKLDAADEGRSVLQNETSHSLYFYSALILPAGCRVPLKEAQDIARMNIIQSALAIERYRLANQDRLPDKLDDLVPSLLPSVPSDPFDGKPLRFKKLPKGYMVYSIGPDRKDDGGVERNPKKPGWPEDITFRVER
jgi:tetratricopeptide (TPR) repeat protein